MSDQQVTIKESLELAEQVSKERYGWRVVVQICGRAIAPGDIIVAIKPIAAEIGPQVRR